FCSVAAPPPELSTLSLHDALPISGLVVEQVAPGKAGDAAGIRKNDTIFAWSGAAAAGRMVSPFDLTEVEAEYGTRGVVTLRGRRSEEHTSELQSLAYLVCRLLLEK